MCFVYIFCSTVYFFSGEPVNTAIGGSRKSQHMKGQAIDIDDTFGHKTNAEMYHYVLIDHRLEYYLSLFLLQFDYTCLRGN